MSGAITKMDRRFQRDGVIRLMFGAHHRGSLIQLSNGRWCLADTREQRLGKLDFLQPSMAHAKFDELYPDGIAA